LEGGWHSIFIRLNNAILLLKSSLTMSHDAEKPRDTSLSSATVIREAKATSAQDKGQDQASIITSGTPTPQSPRDDGQLPANEERGQKTEERPPGEGERSDTLEQELGPVTDNTTSQRRQDGGSWSQSSTDNF
jgi:hypothetical protein